jgi:hypothetical protein
MIRIEKSRKKSLKRDELAKTPADDVLVVALRVDVEDLVVVVVLLVVVKRVEVGDLVSAFIVVDDRGG